MSFRLKISYKIILIAIFAQVAASTSASAAMSEEGYKSLHVFSKVLHYVQDSYVDPTDEQMLVRGAIRGMLSTLDPHSVYLSPQVYRELKMDTAGRFQGVGIEVGIRHGKLTIVSPIKGSPAEKAGVMSGDQIIAINGKKTSDMDLSEAVMLIRGKQGTKVNLTIFRQGQKKAFDVSLLRTVIKVPSVESELIDGKYGYVSVSSFQQGTTKSLEKALKDLRAKANLEGLILDLRQNPGGLLDQAIAMSDLFLDKGVIVSTAQRGKELDKYMAHEEGTEPNYHMVVLADGGSASAAEIVAGALKDNGRAILMGQPTFGKGSVQTVLELDDGGALKLTIARYYTPSGKPITSDGIIPDIEVPAKESVNEVKKETVSEGEEKEEAAAQTHVVKEEPKIVDYQKKMALDYLKKWPVQKDSAKKPADSKKEEKK